MSRRAVFWFLGLSGLALSGVAVTGFVSGYRLNLTPSEPLGLWRIEAIHRPVEIGDLVFICPPATAVFEEARRRGYLRQGLCSSGFAPLIKTVLALPGQYVEVGDRIAVNGARIPASDLRLTDGEGRAIAPFAGGVVPPGHLFLHSSFASSYDSRYFGPIPEIGLLGLAKSVLTFDP
ncbi:conjugative transfer signal peptidase TraF [Rhizobium rhizogenes]|uniref:Conjugative transfer signal peptidase TraF n=3 Tax=Rhizobium TaxID=379 RepID=A0A2Z2PVF8_RHIRH|nr:conjugative transfer signal peptidase TraF [Rhizobium rhizogenes]ASK44266.1 conjugative transfer signal peptidase TraF [Rhizobium rhizogenes]